MRAARPGATVPHEQPRRGRHGARALVALGVAASACAAAAFGGLTRTSPASSRLAAPPEIARPVPAVTKASAVTEVVYAVYAHDGGRTRLVAAPADRPSASRELARFDHAEGYPPRGSLAADGARAVFTRLAPGARASDGAELVVVDLATGAEASLATDAHRLTRPIFVGEGQVVYARKRVLGEPALVDMRGGQLRLVEVELVRVDVATRAAATLARETVVDLQLVGFSPATDEVLAVRRERAGAEVVGLARRDGRTRVVARASGGRELARASVSADGASLLFEEHDEGASATRVSRVALTGIAGVAGEPEALGDASLDEAAPIAAADVLFRPRARGELGLEKLGVGASATRAVRVASASATEAAAAPLAASPDGRYAVTRVLEGPTQVYRIVDATTGGSRPLPPPPGGDLFSMNADPWGFVTVAAVAKAGSR